MSIQVQIVFNLYFGKWVCIFKKKLSWFNILNKIQTFPSYRISTHLQVTPKISSDGALVLVLSLRMTFHWAGQYGAPTTSSLI